MENAVKCMESSAEYKRRTRRESNKKKPKRRRARKISWYWDIKIWFLPMILVMSLVTSCENQNTAADLDYITDNVPAAATEEVTAPTEQKDDIVVSLARFADSVGAGRSDDVKRAIIWVAINRADDRSHGFGLSLLEELERPNQWQQYNPTGNYLESTYTLADEIYNTWRSSGAHMFQDDMLWFVLENDGSITVRNKFRETKGRSEINIA